MKKSTRKMVRRCIAMTLAVAMTLSAFPTAAVATGEDVYYYYDEDGNIVVLDDLGLDEDALNALISGDEVAEDEVAEDEVVEDEVVEDEVVEDEVVEDEVVDDEVVDDEVVDDEVVDDEVVDGEVVDDDTTGASTDDTADVTSGTMSLVDQAALGLETVEETPTISAFSTFSTFSASTFSTSDASTTSTDAIGTSVNNPFYIGNATVLAELAALVNAGTTYGASGEYSYASAYYIMVADINLSGMEWTPIGISSTYAFKGTFDGGNDKYTISGLYINSESSYQGLFGYISLATVQNVTVSGSVSGAGYVGGVVGYSYYGVLLNCHAQVTVTGTAACVGGVAGYSTGTVSNCTNTGAVNSTSYNVGGVVGYSTGSSAMVSNCSNGGSVSSTLDASTAVCLGGVVGQNGTGVVSGCFNYGTVEGFYSYVGGVAGKNDTGSIIDCYNAGTVSSSNTSTAGVVGYSGGTVQSCYNTGAVSGSSSYVGGIVAYNNGTIESCYNEGTVSGYRYVGGVIGDNRGTVANCYNVGAVSSSSIYIGGVAGSSSNGTVQYCYNTGTVSSSSNYIGGIAGYSSSSTVQYCYNTGSIVGTNSGYVGGVVGQNYTGSVVEYCISLAETITTSSSSRGRVVGSNSGTLTNNYAWSGCAIGASGSEAETTGSVDDTNGADLSYSGTAITGTDGDSAEITKWSDIFGTVEGWSDAMSALPNGEALPAYITDVGDYIEISTAEELAKIGVGDAYPLSGNYILTKDIDLDGSATSQWTPIGNYSASASNIFTGTFDGAGFTISGLYIDTSSAYQGLFGYSKGTIKNVAISGSVTSTASYSYVGGIVGYNNAGTVSGCTSIVAVAGSSYIGGIVGYNSNGTVSGCTNNVTVTGGSYVGGIVGYNRLISGTADVSDCINTGSVSGTGGYVGGIVGYNTSATISNCYNTGDVSSTYSSNSDVGGIVGYNSSGTITNSANTGAICSDGTYVGGIAGRNNGTESILTNCYNTGSVTSMYSSAGSSTCVGGIAGQNQGGISNCVSLAQTVAASNAAYADNVKIGRVVGYETYNNLINNYAWSATEIDINGSVATTTGAANDNDGADLTYVNGAGFDAAWSDIFGSDATWTGTVITLPNGEAVPSYITEASGDASGGDATEGWNGEADEYATWSGAGSEADPYIITTGAQLAYLANNIATYGGDSFKLGNDIDLDENEWTPIGSSSTSYFSGTFDGASFTISGLYIDSSSSYQGLFGYISGATIQNLAVEGSVSGSGSVGGIVGYNKGGTVDNCVSNVTVTGSGNYVGGVVGRNTSSSTVANCYNTGSVSGTSDYVGGVVGQNECSTVSNCYNTGSVSGTSDYVGGVVGHNYTSSESSSATVSNCYNTGNVSGSSSNVGGVVGLNQATATSSSVTVSNCYNTGNVSGSSNVGGVVGYNYANTASSSATVSNCYNTGSVSSSGDYVGGVVGYNYAFNMSNSGITVTVSNCYNIGSVSGSSYVGGVVGRNQLTFASSNSSTATVENCVSLTTTITGTGNVGRVLGANNGNISGNYAWSGTSAGDKAFTLSTTTKATAGLDGADLYYNTTDGFFVLDGDDAFDWEDVFSGEAWTIPVDSYQLPYLTDVSEEIPQNPLANLQFITVHFDSDSDGVVDSGESTVSFEIGGTLSASDIPSAPTGKLWEVDLTTVYYVNTTITPVAATASVTTDDDDVATVTNYKTLQAAIDVANATSGAQVTLLASASTTATLNISSTMTLDLNGFDIKADGTGFSVITVGSGANLTLQDSGTTGTRYLTGTGADAVITADDKSGDSDYIAVTGGVIYGGSTTGSGGGVFVSGTFTMNGGTIAGNDAITGTSSYGGGVYVSGIFNLVDGTIAGNAGYTGGGVLSEGELNMSGGTIEYNTATGNGGGVSISGSGRVFTMTGGTIQYNSGAYGGGVIVNNEGSVFTMSAGTITGNTATSNGGGVFVNKGTFNMSDTASITGNKAQNGGGVATLNATSVLNLTGGTITGNTATSNGNGVYHNGGTFNLSGKPSVQAVYLTSGYTIALADAFTGTAIPVTTAVSPTATTPVTVVTASSTYNSGAVSADDAAAFTYGGTTGSLLLINDQLQVVLWSYTLSADGTTITASSDSDDSSCTGNGGTVTLSAPTDTLIYNGSAFAATATDTDWLAATYTIAYYDSDNTALTSAPTNAGTYTAQITLGSVTAKVEYTIAAKALAVTDASATNFTYNGGKAVTVTGGTLSGAVAGDAVALDASAAAGTVGSANVAENAAVTVTGYALSGDDAGNYTLTQPTDVSVTISPLVASFEWSLPSDLVYDGTAKTVTATVSNAVDGDTFTLTYTGNTATVVGSYTTEVTALGNSNYALSATASDNQTSWSIGNADMSSSVSATSYSGIYDGAAHGITVSAPSGATVQYSSDGTTYTADAITYTDVTATGGTTVYYKVTQTNYVDVTGSATVTIAAKDITDADAVVVIGDFTAMTYTGEAQTPVATVTVDGLTATGTWSTVTNVLDTTTFTASGNFTGTLTDVEDGMAKADYDMSGVSFADASYTYNGTVQNLAITGTLPAGADNVQVSVTYSAGETNVVTAKEITATFATTSTNYNAPAAKTAYLTIGKKALEDTMVSTSGSYTYTGKAQEASYAVSDKNGDAEIIASGDYIATFSNNTSAGTATVTITATASGNYSGSASADYTIAQAVLTVESVSVSSKTYDGTTTVTGDATFTISGAQNGETPLLSASFAWDSADAGTKDVTASSIVLTSDTVNANYTLETTEITSAQSEGITAKDITGASIGDFTAMTYTGAAQTPEATVTLGDFTVTGSWSTVTNVTDTTTFTASGNFTGALTDVEDGMLQTTPTVTITNVESVAGITSSVLAVLTAGVFFDYGDTYQATVTVTGVSVGSSAETPAGTVTLTVTGTGTDTLTMSGANGTYTYTWEAENGLDVGDYALSASFVSADDNYTNAATDESVTVTVDEASITGIAVAGYSGIYDGAAHSVSVTGYTVTGETATVRYATSENGAYSTTNPTFTQVGDYTVYYIISADNHTDATGSAAVSITQATPTVTIASVESVAGITSSVLAVLTAGVFFDYGDTYQATVTVTGVSVGGSTETPDGTVTLTGAGASDVVMSGANGTYTYTWDSTNALDVGAYVLSASFACDDSNYTDAATGTSVTITVEETSITDTTVTGYSGTYDGTVYSIRVEGYTTVYGETATVTYATTQDGDYTETNPTFTDAGSYVVYYKITAENHTDTTGSATVTIAKATPTVTIANVESVAGITSSVLAVLTAGVFFDYGDTYQATVTVTGVTVDETTEIPAGTVTLAGTGAEADVIMSGANGTYTYTWDAENGLDVGDYALSANFASADDNYTDGTSDTLDVAVAQKAITGAWLNTSTVYNGSVQNPSMTLAGVEAGDDVSVSYTGGTDAGSYVATATLTGADAGNYTLTNPTTSFTIAKAAATFTMSSTGAVSATTDATGTTAAFSSYTVWYISSSGATTSTIPTASGSYTVYVKITDANYRIAGLATSEGSIGTYTVNAKTYTATFGSTVITSLSGAQVVVPAGTDTATQVFAGWYYGGITYKAGELFTQLEANVIFTALYNNVYTISGTVEQEQTVAGADGLPLANATVTLMYGSNLIDQTVTDETGAYSFVNVPVGTYNVVVSYDVTTRTVLAVIDDENIIIDTITMPAGITNSVVEVTAGTPDIVVGGLDTLFDEAVEADSTANDYTVEDAVVVESGGSVELKLTVEEVTAVADSSTVAAIEAVADENTVGLYLDIDIFKTVTVIEDGTVQSTETSNVTETSSLLQIIIPIPAELQGKESYTIYRQHEVVDANGNKSYEIQAITTTKNAAGEYITLSEDGTEITLYVKYFSTYALAYKEYVPATDPDDEDSGTGDDTSTDDTTVVPTSPSTGQKGVLYWIEEWFISLVVQL